MKQKPYKGEISDYEYIQVGPKAYGYKPNEYGPNLGYIVVGVFENHPTIRGLSAMGARTSLVVSEDSDGNLETLNSRYKLVGEPRKTDYAEDSGGG